MKNVFGYDYVDGKLVVNDNEAKIIKFTYDKVEEYKANPPEVLVNAVLENARVCGEVITYEEAKGKVSFSAILEYITNELNENEEFRDTLRKHRLKKSK